MTRIPSIVAVQRAAFAVTPVIPTPTTASRMAVGAITAMHSIVAREAAQPVPPVTMSTLTILLLMENGQAPATPSISAREPARFVRLPVKNTPTMWMPTAMANATIAVQRFR